MQLKLLNNILDHTETNWGSMEKHFEKEEEFRRCDLKVKIENYLWKGLEKRCQNWSTCLLSPFPPLFNSVVKMSRLVVREGVIHNKSKEVVGEQGSIVKIIKSFFQQITFFQKHSKWLGNHRKQLETCFSL